MSVRRKATSHCSSGVVWNVPGGGPPALTTRTSRPGSLVTADLTRASGSPGFDMSAASQPAALICLAVLSMDTGSRDEMKTSAPSAISASAHARPSPLLAAVTNAPRPFSPRSIASLLSPAGVDVPLRDVLKAISRLDDAVHMHAVHALGDRVVVVRRVEKDRRRRVDELGLEIEIRGQSSRRVDRGQAVLEILIDKAPSARVREVERSCRGTRVPHGVQIGVRADVVADECRLVVVDE